MMKHILADNPHLQSTADCLAAHRLALRRGEMLPQPKRKTP